MTWHFCFYSIFSSLYLFREDTIPNSFRRRSLPGRNLKREILELVPVTDVDEAGVQEILAHDVVVALDDAAEEVFVSGQEARLETVFFNFGQSFDNFLSPSGLHHEISDPGQLKCKKMVNVGL